MRMQEHSEDVATEPIISRVDDASGTFCPREKLFKRNFVLQKLVAVQTTLRPLSINTMGLAGLRLALLFPPLLLAPITTSLVGAIALIVI